VKTFWCARCGVQGEGPEEGMPTEWTFSVEDGRTVLFCSACVRDNIRSIEAKLPEEWWE